MPRISIVVNEDLEPYSAKISKITWQSIMDQRRKKHLLGPGIDSADQVLVGDNVFNPKYALKITDSVDDNLLIVSSDVKSEVYPDTPYLDIF